MTKYFLEYNENGGQLKTPGIILFVAIIIIALLVVSILTGKKNKKNISTKQLAFSSICMALAFALSNVKLFSAPMGGSVTLLSMFFITIVGSMYGTYVGVITGVAYGLLQLIVNPYLVHPIQILVDYPLAFGALGLSGLFYKSKYGIITGYLAGIAGRLLFAVISGVVFFAEYAEGKNVFWYSFTYNISYIGIEGIITIILLLIPAVRNGIGEIKQMATEA